MRIRRQRFVEPVPSDVLAVCTGNICRSAYLAAVLQQRHPGLKIRSAGTGALVGTPAPEPIMALLSERGITSQHVGQQLTPALVRGARLIITATAEHRSSVIAMDTTAADRSFTLLELARLLADTKGRGIDGVLAAARAALAHEGLDHVDDLTDPWRQPNAVYARMAVHIEEALSVIDPWLD